MPCRRGTKGLDLLVVGWKKLPAQRRPTGISKTSPRLDGDCIVEDGALISDQTEGTVFGILVPVSAAAVYGGCGK